MYYDDVLFYVDDVLCIIDDQLQTMKVIQAKLKLKGDNIEEPGMYIGAYLSKMNTVDGQDCWSMSSYKYCTPAVTNVEYVFGKALFKFYAEVCYPSELWLSPRYGCDGIIQGRWSPMVPITHW